MANLLNGSSIMMCPHGGMVNAISVNTRVQAAGGPVLRSSDTFIIAGCPFILVAVPHPCVTVNRVQPDTRSQVMSEVNFNDGALELM